MSTPVSWHLMLKVREGQLEALRSLAREMVESTQQEPGTLSYEWSLSEDGTECHLYERYVSSEAAMVHLGTFGSKFAERFSGCLDMQSIHVYGELSEELRAAHAEFGASFLGTLAGFTR